MAYTKTTWADGDVITADKLNNMEDGIAENQSGGGIRFINFNPDSDGKMLYESGLSLRDFMGAFIGGEDQDGGGMFFIINRGLYRVQNGYINLICITNNQSEPMEFQYYPETGFIQASFPD